MLRRIPHQCGAEAIGQNQSGIVGKDRCGHVWRGREKQAIAVQAIIRPFPVGAEILDRRLDLDDPDFAVAAERDQIGAPPGCERQLAHAGKPERQQKPLRAA